MKYAYPGCKLVLTEREFLLEKIQLGPAFNEDMYVRLENGRLDESGQLIKEGLGSFLLSIGGIIKLIVFGYDKIKELVSKAETETEKEFAKKISKRTLQSLIDEDSHEDHPGKEWFENYLKEEDITWGYTIRKLAAKGGLGISKFEEWMKSKTIAGKLSAMDNDDHGHSHGHGKSKLVKKHSFGEVYIQLLSALGHTFHTLYTLITEGIVEILTFGKLPHAAVDFLANILFMIIILCALLPSFKALVFAGLGKLSGVVVGKAAATTITKMGVTEVAAVASTSTISKICGFGKSVVKVMELTAEAIEVAGGLSIAIEKLKKLVNGKIFKMFLSLTFGPKVSKLVKYFQKKSKKPAESEKNESTIYLKNYIKELIIEMDLKENKKIM